MHTLEQEYKLTNNWSTRFNIGLRNSFENYQGYWDLLTIHKQFSNVRGELGC